MSEPGEVRDTTGEWAIAIRRRPIPRAAICVVKKDGTPLCRISTSTVGQGAPVVVLTGRKV